MIREQLFFLKNMIEELQKNNSSLAKKEILAKYYSSNPQLFTKLMDYVLSYEKRYWIKSTNVLKLWDNFNKKYSFRDSDDLFNVLDKIVNREITGHDAINYVIDLIKFLDKDYTSAIFAIIDKDMHANVSVALVNSITNGAVKEFKVALAERNENAPEIHKVDFADGSWMISRKLDGVRVITTYDNGTILFNSRTGLQFQTLDNLSDDAKKLIEILRQKTNEEYVLDGECCLFINDNQDDFSGIMKEITKKNHTIKNPRYVIFDAIKRKEFDAAVGTTPFKLRMKLLEEIFSENSFTNIALIPHADSIDKETYLEWLEQSKKENWEGLMLRDENSVYTGKRSFDLQKIKSFFDNEYVVIGIEEGKKKMLVNGVMQETQCVKSLVIEHKGTHMNVGSGLSDEERILWLKNPELILNKVITVQYFEESIDSKTGLLSLRFPTLKFVHGNNRNT